MSTTINNIQQSDTHEHGDSIAQPAAPGLVPNIKKIEAYLIQRYHFRFNVVTGKIEFKTIAASEFQTITDYHLNSLARQLSRAHVQCSPNSVRSLLLSDFTPLFNPFKHYFKSLPECDGTDYIQRLAERLTLQTTRSYGFS